MQNDIDKMIACHQCDHLFSKPTLKESEKIICTCCGSVMLSSKKDSINKTISVALAGILLFLPSMLLPIVGIQAVGIYNEASLVDCIRFLVNDDFYIIAFSVFTFTIAMPIVRLSTALYISLCIKYKHITPSLFIFFRSYQVLDNWSMTHVFFMGVIVSLYKLVALADVTIGEGLLSLIALLICSTLVSVTMDPQYIWETMENELEH